jgi:hypothetical protein
MTDQGIRRSLVPGIMLKIVLPLVIGLVALASAEAGGIRGGNSLVLTAIVTLGAALILFMVDTEKQISAVDEHIAAGFAKFSRLAELSAMMDRSVFDTELLTNFIETAGQADERVNPLLQRLTRREINRMTSFMRLLPVGSEIAYEGEDRDWLLGLTLEAECSIDAISLSTVDAGVRGLDGGLWTSDLGIRYLDFQRTAIAREVSIRRIFVFENADMALDETFLRITQMQRDIGVEVRMLDDTIIPDGMQSMIFDFIVFDGTISYETTPATAAAVGQTRPGILRTRLMPIPDRVRELEDRFKQLWEAADPERQIKQVGRGPQPHPGSVSPGAANT